MKQVGIYAGTFDPVHAGHLAFARAAIESSQLDMVYFLPERYPRHKPNASSFEWRVERLRAALTGSIFESLVLSDHHLSARETLPELQQRFPHTRLTFLVGSDVALQLSNWRDFDTLARHCDFLVGMRNSEATADVHAALHMLCRYRIVTTAHAHLSSSAIRAGI